MLGWGGEETAGMRLSNQDRKMVQFPKALFRVSVRFLRNPRFWRLYSRPLVDELGSGCF